MIAKIKAKKNTSTQDESIKTVNKFILKKNELLHDEKYKFMEKQLNSLSKEQLRELLIKTVSTSILNERFIFSCALTSNLSKEEVDFLSATAWLIADATHNMPTYIKHLYTDDKNSDGWLNDKRFINDIVEYAALIEVFKKNIVGVFETLNWALIYEIFEAYLPEEN